MTKRLEPGEIAQLVDWREQGRGYAWIAVRLGVSAGAVYYQCLKHGAISPRQYVRPVPTQPSSMVAGDGRIQRRFTQAEDASLLSLEAQGLSYSEIARAVGRPFTSTRMRIMLLAQRDEIAA